MTINESKLRDALERLLETYIIMVDSACYCHELIRENEDDEPECVYCYAKRILKEIK